MTEIVTWTAIGIAIGATICNVLVLLSERRRVHKSSVHMPPIVRNNQPEIPTPQEMHEMKSRLVNIDGSIGCNTVLQPDSFERKAEAQP